MCQTVQNFKQFSKSIENIYLVEASAPLREIQKNLLCGPDAVLEEIDIGYRGINKHTGAPIVWVEDIRLLPYSECALFTILATGYSNMLQMTKCRSYLPTNSLMHFPYMPLSLSSQALNPKSNRNNKS